MSVSMKNESTFSYPKDKYNFIKEIFSLSVIIRLRSDCAQLWSWLAFKAFCRWNWEHIYLSRGFDSFHRHTQSFVCNYVTHKSFNSTEVVSFVGSIMYFVLLREYVHFNVYQKCNTQWNPNCFITFTLQLYSCESAVISQHETDLNRWHFW